MIGRRSAPASWAVFAAVDGADAKRCPVMMVAIDGAVNAALSAVRILSLSDDELAQKHRAYIAQRDDVLRQMK